MEEKNINILCLFPGPIYRPDLPDFQDRFKMLSHAGFSGNIISWTIGLEFSKFNIENFLFHGLQKTEHKCLTKLKLIGFSLKKAINIHKRNKINVIICYDAVFTGLIGSILKIILNCKLVIEINNSNMKEAVCLTYKNKIIRFLKVFSYHLFSSLSLLFADAIKLLTDEQKGMYSQKYKKKVIACFHDFVPTHCFANKNGNLQNENTILFVGFPFYLKGIDVLIKAFDKISKQFPSFKLKLVGHQLEENAKKYFQKINKNIVFSKGVFYDKIKPEFEKCYCFVLPSRTEGMGRVLLEAMACGKPIIGSNVGGIPNVITNDLNGFLFESENVDDLANKLEKLLADPIKAKAMGEKGQIIANSLFSSNKYCEYFKKMVNETMNL